MTGPTSFEDSRPVSLGQVMATGEEPVISPLPPATAKILRLLEQAAAKTGYHNHQIFDKALQVWTALSTDPQLVDMNHWLNEVCVGIERGLSPLVEAYWALLESASWCYEDVLGSVYMDLWVSNGRTGQFFTPMHLARAMAEVTLADLSPRSPGDPPYKICDPCCGSGVMFLACMEYFEVHWPHMLDNNLVEFYGQDVDFTCCAMARLNLRFHRAGRILRHEMQSGGNPAVSLDSHGAMVPALALPPQATFAGQTGAIRRTDTLSDEERAMVEAAIGGPLPVQERFPLEEQGGEATAATLQRAGAPGPTVAPARRRPAVKAKENGAQGGVQPRLFVTDLPLPVEDGAQAQETEGGRA